MSSHSYRSSCSGRWMSGVHAASQAGRAVRWMVLVLTVPLSSALPAAPGGGHHRLGHQVPGHLRLRQAQHHGALLPDRLHLHQRRPGGLQARVSQAQGVWRSWLFRLFSLRCSRGCLGQDPAVICATCYLCSCHGVGMAIERYKARALSPTSFAAGWHRTHEACGCIPGDPPLRRHAGRYSRVVQAGG